MQNETDHEGPSQQRHLLIAISNDPRALHGVKFVSGFFSDFTNIKATLFASLPARPVPMVSENVLGTREELVKMRADLRESFADAMTESREILEQAGMAPEDIDGKIEPGIHSTDFHLAHEGNQGLYDALVLGRRSLESLVQIFEDSTTERLLENKDINLPCWACRQYRPGRRNILLCLDAAPGREELVDHVGYMCGLDQKHSVTLFHVRKSGDSRDTANNIFNEAINLLSTGGMPSDRIRVAFAEGAVPARVILRKAEEGRFAAVALGRKGAPGNRFRKLFTGSTSRTVLRELTGAGTWFAG